MEMWWLFFCITEDMEENTLYIRHKAKTTVLGIENERGVNTQTQKKYVIWKAFYKKKRQLDGSCSMELKMNTRIAYIQYKYLK